MPLDFLTLGADTAIRDTLYDDFIDWNNAAFALDMLPEARPRFHVASLSDKPQNPIIEALDVLYHAPKSGDIHPHVAAYNPGVAKFDDIPHAWDLGTLVQLPNDRERVCLLSFVDFTYLNSLFHRPGFYRGTRFGYVRRQHQRTLLSCPNCLHANYPPSDISASMTLHITASCSSVHCVC